MDDVALPEHDPALREDIRLLGRVLGDTVRQQQGEAVFATVERIRQISIQFRRDDDDSRPIGTGSDPQQPLARHARSRSCAPSAISRISPTSPRTSTTSAARAPRCGATAAAARGHDRHALARARAAKLIARSSCRTC